MAQAFLNRCIWTAASSGTGSFVVSAAAQSGYKPADCLNPVMVNGATYHYFAVNGTEHEEGDGVWTTSTSALTRGTVRNSSNSGSAVSFTAAPTVFMGGPIATDLTDIVAEQVTIASGTITSSKPNTVTQTWNNAANNFSAYVINVTNTASADPNNSRAISVVIDGSEAWGINASGFMLLQGGYSATDGSVAVDSAFDAGISAFALNSSGQIGWSATGNWFDGYDAGFARNAAGIVEVNNGTPGTLATLTAASLLGGSASGGVGYAKSVGAGGAVTQATSKSTAVTLSKATGQITMSAAALAASTTVSFTLTNTAIAAGDILVLNHVSGGTAGSYHLNAQCAAGSASINVRNISTASLSEAIVIGFAVFKGATS